MSCGICGGQLVLIRSRIPRNDEAKREVCPTCLADRMDLIREIAAPEYGQAYEAKPIELIKK